MVAILIPDRSLEQRMAALDRANQIRFGRAALKQDVAAGDVRAADVLARPPACARTMKVYDLLRAIPRWGEVKTLKLMARCQVSPGKRIDGLSGRQRDGLIDALGEHAAGAPMSVGPRQTATPSRRYPGGRCAGCGLYMPRRTPERLCGFCAEELA